LSLFYGQGEPAWRQRYQARQALTWRIGMQCSACKCSTQTVLHRLSGFVTAVWITCISFTMIYIFIFSPIPVMGQHFTLGAGPAQIMGQHVYGCMAVTAYELDLNVLPLGNTSATLRYPPLPASLWIYDFIWLPCPFSENYLTTNNNIGIRIFIRIIYYPINGYLDSKLSVLSFFKHVWVNKSINQSPVRMFVRLCYLGQIYF